MIHFIPAWYSKNEWKENEQLWHRRRAQTEMDDTVKQIQLFHRNQICECKILLLSFAPNFRHFLHRQSVFRAPYWSCFDAIQGVRRKKQALLSFHNLNWPQNIEFIYSPFAIIAMLNGEKYAQIEFGEDGNLIQVDIYQNEQLKRKNIYDDRGFISCTEVYENGKKAYEQYLAEDGIWKICHFADGHVTVNPRSNFYLITDGVVEKKLPFTKQSYDSMEMVIKEVLESYLAITDDDDIFCAALHERHINLLDQILADKKTIFSIFGDRLLVKNNEHLKKIVMHADYIVTDTEEHLKEVQRETKLVDKCMTCITPYDARVDFGISQQLTVQKVLVPVDMLSDSVFEETIRHLANYLRNHENVRVHLFTRNAAYNRDVQILEVVAGILKKYGFPTQWARKSNDHKFEFILDEEDKIPICFVVEQCVDELEVSKCLREQRVIMDLAEVPDLFLQISAVSMGIPQILKVENQYMISGKNGRLIEAFSEIQSSLSYYLESLANWNRAMINSYELGKTYTTQRLIEQWKEVIRSVEHSTSITIGK